MNATSVARNISSALSSCTDLKFLPSQIESYVCCYDKIAPGEVNRGEINFAIRWDQN